MAWKLKDNIPPEPASVTDLIEGDLEEVTTLSLIHRGLRCLPNDLDKLTNLMQLLLWGNDLRVLPDSLDQLQNLQYLDVGSNPLLRYLPQRLFNLHKLSGLRFSDTAIQSLPVGLEHLSIKSLALPRWFNNLPRWPVVDLALWDMSDEEVAVALSHYPEVDRLTLRGNGLAALIKFQSLSRLTDLTVFNHPLSSFPDIRIFPNLSKVALWGCKLQSLPPWIGTCNQLKELDLSLNEIVSLPSQLAGLGDGLTLDLSGNPLISPLDEIAKQGTPALFAYLRSLPDDREPEIDSKLESADVPDQQAAPLEVAMEDGRLVARGQAGTAEAARREFLSMYDMVKKRAVQAVQAIGGNHAKLVGLLREYQDFLGETVDALQGIPLGFTGQALAIQTAHSREEDGSDLLSQDQRASLEILLAAHELLMRSVPEWQDYVLKTGQRPPLSDEIDMLVRTLSRGIVVDLRQRPKEIDRHVPDRLQELVDLDAAMPADQGQLSRWGMVDALGNILSALAKEALATAKEIPKKAREMVAENIIGLGAAAAYIFLGHAPELLALAQSLPGYGWISWVISVLRSMAG